jgi:opacity protein-like surface antigen
MVLAAMTVIAMLLSTSAIAQERQHAYSEYTFWLGGSFENGHAFSSTVGARNYQLESRYERLIYWREPFAVRWVFEAIPLALVRDPHTRNGHRAYAYGVGGSPIGAQVNFVHYRHIEPFLTSGGGFLYFNHRMFGTTQQFNFTAQLGGGVQLFTSSRRTAIDLGYKYHHISNANLGNQNPGLDSHMLFVGVSLFR